ncbi:LysE family translocator [Prosthecodimorpha staleyi]|uniref:LysE family translocator n=1 Tax=Prosthecodimorpha staleyi TaxID=2840188 RepID=A0A947D4T8_9HYPH|nr:LysE family translocator [Prosthecodimorpha staleyi]MBT9288192.1 LysE family translocator [Prosthecodimorpha staleyi]
MTTEFLLVTLIVVASPGTGVLYTLSTALAGGRWAGVVAAAGCTLGIVPHLAAALTGLAALFHTSALAFDMLRYAGVAYLLAMAWRTLRDASALGVEAAGRNLPAGRIVIEAIAVNLLNPKLPLFFMAFLPQFLPAHSPDAVVPMLELSGLFMAITFAVFALYGIAAGSVRRAVMARPRVVVWMRRLFALAFVGLGLRLVAVER